MARFIKILIIIALLLFGVLYALNSMYMRSLKMIMHSYPGAAIEIGGYSGTILTGFTLSDVDIQPAVLPQGIPPIHLIFPALRIKKSTAQLPSEISWDEASIVSGSGSDLYIPIGPGSLEAASDGWLRTGNAVAIGDAEWAGGLVLGVSSMFDQVEGTITIGSLPPEQLAAFGLTQFDGLAIQDISTTIEFSGPVDDINGAGHVELDLLSEPLESGATGLVFSGIQADWNISPFKVTSLSWEPGAVQFLHDGSIYQMVVDGGVLIPGSSGWLVSESPVLLGEPEWNGTLVIRLTDDLGTIQGEIEFTDFPVAMSGLFTSIPDGFIQDGSVQINIRFNGPSNDPDSFGQITNLDNHQNFRF